MNDSPFNGFNALVASILRFRKQLLERSLIRSLTFCMPEFEQPNKLANSHQIIELTLLTGS